MSSSMLLWINGFPVRRKEWKKAKQFLSLGAGPDRSLILPMILMRTEHCMADGCSKSPTACSMIAKRHSGKVCVTLGIDLVAF